MTLNLTAGISQVLWGSNYILLKRYEIAENRNHEKTEYCSLSMIDIKRPKFGDTMELDSVLENNSVLTRAYGILFYFFVFILLSKWNFKKRLQQRSFFIRPIGTFTLAEIGIIEVTVMLVTSLCWWLNYGDHYKMLMTNKYVGDIPIGHRHHNMPECDVTSLMLIRYVDFSPTSKSCHQHIWSPTSM